MYSCPVCGFGGLRKAPFATWPIPEGEVIAPPYRVHLGAPSYEACRRCGYEFGVDDEPWADEAGDSFEVARLEWIAKGRPWADQSARPSGEL